jgi:hypothetical protein
MSILFERHSVNPLSFKIPRTFSFIFGIGSGMGYKETNSIKILTTEICRVSSLAVPCCLGREMSYNSSSTSL